MSGTPAQPNKGRQTIKQMQNRQRNIAAKKIEQEKTTKINELHRVLLTGNAHLVKSFIDTLNQRYNKQEMSTMLLTPYQVSASDPKRTALELAQSIFKLETDEKKKKSLEKIICILEKEVIVKPKLMNLFSPPPKKCNSSLDDLPEPAVSASAPASVPASVSKPSLLTPIPEEGVYNTGGSRRSRSKRSKKRSHKAKRQ